MSFPLEQDLGAIAMAMRARRPAVLARWREAVEGDPELTTVSALSRAQFEDHIPEVLDAFERRLAAPGGAAQAEVGHAERESALGHGLVRWQQGYRQRELMREWRHLHLALIEELEAVAREEPRPSGEAIAHAHRALATLAGDGVCESATQYALMLQAEAAGRLRDLEQALAAVRRVQADNAALLREVVHDLRGGLGMVHHATAAVRQGIGDRRAKEIVEAAERGVASMLSLLEDLIGLARLEAGIEPRELQAFDAAVLLRELAAAARPLAAARGLGLVASGPESLAVEGDPVKVRRLVQNLLLNALSYTLRGGVELRWSTAPTAGVPRWLLDVRDTGPGLNSAAATPLAVALKDATDEAAAVTEAAAGAAGTVEPPRLLASGSEAAPRPGGGEGIGIAIVKRLCELLDAALEVHSEPGTGTAFRVVFPRRYE